jgi:hypothetical protein
MLNRMLRPQLFRLNPTRAGNTCHSSSGDVVEYPGIPASEGRGVYLRGQQDGDCQVCAARETTLVDPSRELEKLGNTATHATVTNRILINAF